MAEVAAGGAEREDAIDGTDAAAGPGTLELERLLPGEDEPQPSVRDGGLTWCWRAVFVAHFLRTWAERAWEFAVGLILLALDPDTLWLVALYGLLENLAVLLFGPSVGSWLDRQASHIHGALWTFQCQNACNILSAALAFSALMLKDRAEDARLGRGVLIGGMIFASCLARLASSGATMSVEKKWLKALCACEPQTMAGISAALRRIDLVCLFAAPIFTGTLMTFRGLRDASVALAAWNVVAWGPQVLLLRRAARMARLDELSGEEGAVPAEEVGEAAGRTAFDPDGRGDTGEYEDGKEGVVPPAWYPGNLISNALGRLKVFWRQRMALAMLALAMLYFSVLSLGLIMTSYLKWSGISEAELSVFRGTGAIVSVTATVTFPPLHKRLGASMAGVCGISAQLLCLTVAVALLFFARMAQQTAGFSGAMYLMLTSLMLSRWGLWTFDLSVTQLMQEGVSEDELGVTSGVQGSLQSLFELSISIVIIYLSSPAMFPWLGLVSLVQVLLAFLVYSTYYIRHRQQRSQEADLRIDNGDDGEVLDET